MEHFFHAFAPWVFINGFIIGLVVGAAIMGVLWAWAAKKVARVIRMKDQQLSKFR